jgi:hypothetical protein
MRVGQKQGAKILPFPVRRRPADIADIRFRALLGEAGWARLPESVRRRFGQHVEGGRTLVYVGEIVECRMSRAGWWLAQLGRLIGSPLPLGRDALVPATVSVTEDKAGGGQLWTRIYGRAHGFPQVVHSAKRFAGPTGLEEYVGCGIGVALTLHAEKGALHFDSEHYFLRLGRIRLRVPRWLEPGRLRVSHIDCNHGCFAFVLKLDHPRLGELICQTGLFRDQPSGEA